MHIYRYGTLMRPPGPGAVPRRGLLNVKNTHQTAPSGHKMWGWAEYNRPLTDEEISEYELEFIAVTVINDGKDKP